MNTLPPNGGANQRARTNCDSLARTSLRAPRSTVVSIVFLGARLISHASGTAQILVSRDQGRASGSSSTVTSALSSHKSVNGSSDSPVVIARERNTPLIPPALAPATISVNTLSRVPDAAAICTSSARYTPSTPPDGGASSKAARLARTSFHTSLVTPCIYTARLIPP